MNGLTAQLDENTKRITKSKEFVIKIEKKKGYGSRLNIIVIVLI